MQSSPDHAQRVDSDVGRGLGAAAAGRPRLLPCPEVCAAAGVRWWTRARSSGRFRPEHQQFWDLARRRRGDTAGTRALCDVLLLHRHHDNDNDNDNVISGICAALSIDSVDAGVVAVETRRAIEHL